MRMPFVQKSIARRGRAARHNRTGRIGGKTGGALSPAPARESTRNPYTYELKILGRWKGVAGKKHNIKE